MVDEVVQFIPERYHAKSELTVEVVVGDNEIPFKLTADLPELMIEL